MRTIGWRLLAAAALLGALALAPATSHAVCAGGAENGTIDTLPGGSLELCDGNGDPDDCCAADCTFLAQGTSCDDDEECTVNTKCDGTDVCAGGSAAPSGTQCREEDLECVTRTCDGKDCTGPVVSDPCDDGNSCTLDVCTNPATLACANFTREDGSTCGTGDASCDSSICQSGVCTPGMAPDGAECDLDDNLCTMDTCLAGVCGPGTTNDCSSEPPPSSPCKFNECQPSTGQCAVKNRPKGYDCPDDGKECTKDECGTHGRCRHPAKPGGTFCYEDTNSCSTERCNSSGKCSEGAGFPTTWRPHGSPCDDPTTTAVEGNDNNQCTIDYCKDPGTGMTTCVHEITIAGTTETTEGDPCTKNACTDTATCVSGACTSQTCFTEGACGPCGAACQDIPGAGGCGCGN